MITNNSKLGIGENNPSETIHADGNIKASGEVIASSITTTGEITSSDKITGDAITDTVATLQNGNLTGIQDITASGKIETYDYIINTISGGYQYFPFSDPNDLGFDKSMHARHADIIGSIQHVTNVTDSNGKTRANAMKFDQTDEQRFNLDAYSNAYGPMRSMSLWFRSEHTSNQTLFIVHSPWSSSWEFKVELRGSNGQIEYRARAGGTQHFQIFSSVSGLNDNNWHHVVILCGTGGGARLFTDGTQRGSGSSSATPNNTSTSSASIGRRRDQ